MSNWSSDFVQTNGIRMHYHRTGGDKPPVVLSHGITDSGLCWPRVAQALAQDYNVVLVDARGHGHSTAPETGYSAQDHAADMAGLIEALALEKPALIGHSMGAVIAATVAGEYPHLISRIILEDPVWRLEARSLQQLQARMESWQQEIIEQQSKSEEALIAFGRQRSPEWHEIEFAPWVSAKKLVNPNALQFVLAENSWQESLPKIACPALLVTAEPELGAIVTPETAKYVAETNAHFQVVHIEEAGHNIRREQYQSYIAAVQHFLVETSVG